MHNETTFCPNCLQEISMPGGVCEHCGFDIPGYTVLPHQLIPGSLIKQRYRVGRVLGEGGFGITYVGWDTVLNIKTAIKEFYMSGYVNRNHDASPNVFATLGPHRDTFTKNKDKFLSEARVLAHFYEEPGIVGVRDFCEENGTAYIIMDFLEGVTLKEYLRQHGRLSPTEAVHLLLPVIRSLQRVHAEGIIHRDISPDNIMVLPSGQTKLLDFGAAREISQTDIKSLSVILKPGYAPEEQYRSKGRQGPWTDVYALAATLYRCITGQEPDDAMERMYRDQLPAPAATEGGCPIAISNVIMKAMAVRQPDRYQDVGAFLAGLEQALATPDDPAIAPDTREQTGARPAAPDGSRTVLADETTGRTVLADLPALGEADAAPAAAQKPEAPAAPAAQPEAPAAPAQPKAAPQPAPQKAETPKTLKAPEKNTKKKPPILPIAAVAAVVVIGAAVLWPKGGSPAAPAATSSAPAASSSEPAAAAENSTAGGETPSAVTGEITLTDTVAGGEDSKVYRSFILNGVEMELPAALSSFYDQGWVLEDESLEGTQLAPGEELNSTNLINEYGYIQINVENQTQLTQPINTCTVTSLTVASTSFNDNYLDEVQNTFQMSEDIGMDDPLSQALALYPGSKIDEYDDLEYESDTIRLMISEYQGNINFYALTVNDLVPKWVDVDAHITGEPSVYSNAAFMQQYGLSGFAFTIEGDVYTDPLTIQTFVDNGWTLEKSPDKLPAMSSSAYYLRKDVRTAMQIAAINFTENGIDPVYGLAYGFEIGNEDNLSATLVDPDAQLAYEGTKLAAIGDPKGNVEVAAQTAGLVATQTDDGKGTIYATGEDASFGAAVRWDDAGCVKGISIGVLDNALSVTPYYYE